MRQSIGWAAQSTHWGSRLGRPSIECGPAAGAPDEQLALRLSKACAALPGLDFIVRAEEHSCVVVMKNASEKCEWLQPLILALVSRLSSGQRQPGGFARYVHNSPRFKRKVAFLGGGLRLLATRRCAHIENRCFGRARGRCACRYLSAYGRVGEMVGASS